MVPDTKQASSATTAITFITIGALMTVWSSVYYFLYLRHNEAGGMASLWCYGFFFSGLVLMVIGIGLGHIGRAVRSAEVVTPPPTAPVQTATPATATTPAAPGTPAATVPATGVAQPVVKVASNNSR